MTAERDVRESPPPRIEPPGQRGVSRTAVYWAAGIAALLVAWFFFAWLVLGLNVVDAAGESIGSALALLVIVSVVGAIKRRRR